MSDQKKTDDKDIVAKAEDEPQVLQDEQLEDADGGFSFSFNTKSVKTFSAPTGQVFETITANADTDKLIKGKEAFLRTRPGRF
ncbi:MAG: hypothetical protein AAGC79_15665, partial [Pseudomonadota bacterium]